MHSKNSDDWVFCFRNLVARLQALSLEPDTTIEGEVVGGVGHVVFLEETDGRFALDLGALKARVLELDPTARGRRPSVQLGLF